LLDQWDPREVLRLIESEDLNSAGGAPFFLTSLLDDPRCGDVHLERLHFQGMGGAPIPRAVVDRATRLGLTVFSKYGSTEHPSITGCNYDDPLDKRLSSNGRPMPGNEIRLVDPEGREVKPGEPGEILSRGPECFLGYTDSTLTAKVFDADGWYHTGDIGVLDLDGYLSITDRIADVIIRGGENISAAEIEELLMGLDEVAEVCVVAEPDERLGEHAAAVLRLRDGRTAPSVQDLGQRLGAAGLSRQKWPEAVYQVEEFPRTPSGKVQKFVLRRQLREGALGAPSRPDER
jgi:acyl-CoA synthetase (AMP-forming)/AMP-acid ligase II